MFRSYCICRFKVATSSVFNTETICDAVILSSGTSELIRNIRSTVDLRREWTISSNNFRNCEDRSKCHSSPFFSRTNRVAASKAVMPKNKIYYQLNKMYNNYVCIISYLHVTWILCISITKSPGLYCWFLLFQLNN